MTYDLIYWNSKSQSFGVLACGSHTPEEAVQNVDLLDEGERVVGVEGDGKAWGVVTQFNRNRAWTFYLVSVPVPTNDADQIATYTPFIKTGFIRSP